MQVLVVDTNNTKMSRKCFTFLGGDYTVFKTSILWTLGILILAEVGANSVRVCVFCRKIEVELQRSHLEIGLSILNPITMSEVSGKRRYILKATKGRIQDFHLWGRKSLCVRTHITSGGTELSFGRGPGPCIFQAFWREKIGCKKNIIDQILGGRLCLLRPPPPPWIRHPLALDRRRKKDHIYSYLHAVQIPNGT